jgi:hypothetical protein
MHCAIRSLIPGLLLSESGKRVYFACLYTGRNGCLGMAKSDPKKEPELHFDAWARFERAVDVVAKSPPQHRAKAAVGPKRRKKGQPKKIVR